MATDSPKGSFVRWQSTTIAQLTYAVNLVLGFSVAALAFQVTTLLNKEFNPVSWQKCAFSISLLALMVSVGLGIWCVVNRLRDFRATAKVARMREQKKSDEEMGPLRVLSEKLGNKTWSIFWWQIGTFGVGVLLLVLGIAGSVSQKLL
ncbi:hypothetical protein [Thioalkalivibrio thiocyanodenitrificans]|uniref:hypothetical protein n=1 Tax=Thioalkalivibrio thiocyanodenitrificans TaxID=243063 RepID=UPI0012EA649B|nr:hypothetical protein [Thioalkalivibrio thiocyanodenitrificans]